VLRILIRVVQEPARRHNESEFTFRIGASSSDKERQAAASHENSVKPVADQKNSFLNNTATE
jgi:hypothetical protein